MAKTYEFTERYEASGFGYGGFGNDEFDDDEDANDINKRELAERISNRLVATSPYADTFTRWLDVYAHQLYELDRTMDTLYNERFITSATGEHLEQFGEPVSIDRKNNESDESIRARISAARIAAASEGTTHSLIETATEALQSTSFSIESAEDVGGGSVRISTTSAVIDDTPLSESEIETLCERSLPPTHTVSLVTDDSFVFSGTDSGAGFGVGVWDSNEN